MQNIVSAVVQKLLWTLLVCTLSGCAVPAGASGDDSSAGMPSITASASRDGACSLISDLYGRYFGNICARGTASFTMHSLDGVSVDWPAAEAKDVCVLYVLGGKGVQEGSAIIYPETAFLPQGLDLEAAASRLAPFSTPAQYSNRDGLLFALRFLDEPVDELFPIQVKAYCAHNDALLILTLAARSHKNLQEHLPTLHTLMDYVTVGDLKIVPDF